MANTGNEDNDYAYIDIGGQFELNNTDGPVYVNDANSCKEDM